MQKPLKSARAEMNGFMLVEALPQTPANKNVLGNTLRDYAIF